MPVTVKLGSNGGGFFASFFRFLLVVMLFCVLCGGAIFGYYYFKYQSVVEERLAAGPLFASVAQIYAAPKEVRIGQHLTAGMIAADLRAAGVQHEPRAGDVPDAGRFDSDQAGGRSRTTIRMGRRLRPTATT